MKRKEKKKKPTLFHCDNSLDPAPFSHFLHITTFFVGILQSFLQALHLITVPFTFLSKSVKTRGVDSFPYYLRGKGDVV